ncbi:hypothetical protein CN918_32525 [Priestia megaterium]|nr:hypothetical protein CN918_32525 [Priestia megaterium]
MDRFREQRKEKNPYERLKDNYAKIEDDRLQKIKDVNRRLKYKKAKREEQLEKIREKHLAKKRKENIEKAKVTRKGKKRR